MGGWGARERCTLTDTGGREGDKDDNVCVSHRERESESERESERERERERERDFFHPFLMPLDTGPSSLTRNSVFF